MENIKSKRAKRQETWAEAEEALLAGKDHPLLKLPKDTEKLKLNDETYVSQAILEHVSKNFTELKKLDIKLEYDDYAPRLDFSVLSFPKLERLDIDCVGLTSIDFRKENYPSLKGISMDNIVGRRVKSFHLDLPTLESFNCQFLTILNADDFAKSLSRCTNLASFGGYKLWGLSDCSEPHELYLPNCEHFDIYRSDDVEHLEIYAPKLKKLNLQACYSLKHIHLVDDPFGLRVQCFKCNKEENGETKLKRCAKCKIAQYCSVECQKEHFEEHKENCGKTIRVNVVNANIGSKSMKMLRANPRVKKIYEVSEEEAMNFLLGR